MRSRSDDTPGPSTHVPRRNSVTCDAPSALENSPPWGDPFSPGHFVASITYHEGLMALPRPGQVIDWR